MSDLKENTAVRRSEIRKPLQQSLPLAIAVRKIYFLRSVPKLLFSQDSSSENTCLEPLQRNWKFRRAVTTASDRCKEERISQTHTAVFSLRVKYHSKS